MEGKKKIVNNKPRRRFFLPMWLFCVALRFWLPDEWVSHWGNRSAHISGNKQIIRTLLQFGKSGSDYIELVREMGLEPTRRNHTHLKRACLPFQHSRKCHSIICFWANFVKAFLRFCLWFLRQVHLPFESLGLVCKIRPMTCLK